jgi:hypothetical protein
MKDFFGVDVKLGDSVVCMVKNYRSLMEATVIKITDKTVVVEYLISHSVADRTYKDTYRLMSDQFIIVGE